MIAYKFLRSGGVGRFSGHGWDTAGGWVEAAGPLELCRNGVHACEPADLSYWLDDELWVVELAGELLREETVLVARRARLVDQVAAWPEAAAELAQACAERAAEIAAADARLAEYAADATAYAARGPAGAPLAAYAAAVAAESLAAGGFVRERRRQGRWLATRLALAGA